ERPLVPGRQVAPPRKRMYEIFSGTGRMRTTTKLWNEAGYRTREGHNFGYATVKRLLRDTTAKGIHTINRSKNVGRNKSYQIKPRSEWVEVQIEAIIPVEMWEQVNQILDKRKEGYKPHGKPPVQLFSGLTYCHCGRRMYPRAN